MENKWKQWISGFGKKGKLPAKQPAFDPAFGRNPAGGGRFPGSDQKDPEIGTGAGQEETETEGGEATEQQYERLLEKRVEDTWNAWRESGK
mgnify:CR=1 FL=1